MRKCWDRPLIPFHHNLAAVRIGDLEAFQAVLTQHSAKFAADGTHSLIVRLRHNVIKTALRMISLAYSRISLQDVCLKLHLDSEEDTEYIVAKAIRDGVIDAEVDHAKGWMKSREAGNVYETDEPQKAFQQRIEFCMNLHNDSVKVRAEKGSFPAARGFDEVCHLVFLGNEVPNERQQVRSVHVLCRSAVALFGANISLLNLITVGEDSELARERKLDIEAALAEAAEDEDMDM